MSNVNPPRARKAQREAAQQFIDTLQGMAFPNSRRIYLQGSRSDIQVPMREIQLSPTLVGGSKDNPQYEPNEAIPVYDTAGPYGDPQAELDVHAGLAAAYRLDRRARRYRHPKRRQFRLYPTAAGGRGAGSPALRTSAAAAQGAAGQVCDPAALCPRRYRHPRDGVHRHP